MPHGVECGTGRLVSPRAPRIGLWEQVAVVTSLGSLARVDSDRGIPDFVESEALKVFDICGGEFLYPKSLQAQGIDAPAGKVRSGGLFPDLCVDVSASRWEPDDLPPWMKSVALDDFNRFAWIQRFLKNGWISEKKMGSINRGVASKKAE